MSEEFRLNIDSDRALDAALREMDEWPEGMARAKRRALSKLSTWARTQTLRATAKAIGTTQKQLKLLVRYKFTRRAEYIAIWIGTAPIAVHRLGKVRWTPRMQGARVGRRSYPGSWSWQVPKRTAGLVMQRLGDARMPIDVVREPVHEPVARAIATLQPQIGERYRTLMRQELNYVLNVERARASA